MRLVLGVDFVGPPIQFDGDVPRNSWPVELDCALVEQITQWNDDFVAAIIKEENLANSARIEELNTSGRELSRKIAQSLGKEWTVRYREE